MSSVVAVVSVGARTPIGLNARQTGFLLRAGFPAMDEAPLANAAGEAIPRFCVRRDLIPRGKSYGLHKQISLTARAEAN